MEHGENFSCEFADKLCNKECLWYNIHKQAMLVVQPQKRLPAVCTADSTVRRRSLLTMFWKSKYPITAWLLPFPADMVE